MWIKMRKVLKNNFNYLFSEDNFFSCFQKNQVWKVGRVRCEESLRNLRSNQAFTRCWFCPSDGRWCLTTPVMTSWIRSILKPNCSDPSPWTEEEELDLPPLSCLPLISSSLPPPHHLHLLPSISLFILSLPLSPNEWSGPQTLVQGFPDGSLRRVGAGGGGRGGIHVFASGLDVY